MARDMSAEILREQVRLVFRQLPTMQTTSFLVALVLSYVVRNIVPPGNIVAWILMILAVVAIRIVLYYRFMQIRDTPFAGVSWERACLITTLLSGILWGLSAFLIFPSGNLALISLFVLVFASLSATTTVSHSSIRFAPTAWSVAAMLPYSVRCFFEGGEIGYALSFLIVLYLVTILRYSFLNHDTIKSAISLEFENIHLLEEVRKGSEVLESTVEARTLELRRSEQKYRHLVETANSVILTVDTVGTITFLNGFTERFFGFSKEELLGRNVVGTIIPSTDSSDGNFSRMVEEILKAPDRFMEYENENVTRDGRRVWVRWTNKVIVDPEGNIEGILTIGNDVTARMRLEEERLKSQKLEAIGVLAGGIAHDFNNLLQCVFGYLSMAKQNLDRKQMALDMLDEAEKALAMSVNLTTQLLTYSKGGKPAKKKTRISPVIENTVKFALSGSRSGFHIDTDEGLWHVEADEGQIGQVIQNIVLNSNEAMPEGGTVEVRAGNIELPVDGHVSFPEGGRFVRITISDSGIGIPEQYLSKIFDPYFTTKQKGSGLGLATAYSIVKNHGGAIEVQSMPEKGSTFTVYLPASEDPGEEKGDPTSSSSMRSGRILVMDDEEMVRKVAREMISSLGHSVVCAENGEAAVEKFQEAMTEGNPFDVVILDLTVKGGMGGEETVKLLRKIDPEARVIVSSGYADNPIVSDYSFYGFSTFLNKPYNIKALQDRLSGLLRS